MSFITTLIKMQINNVTANTSEYEITHDNSGYGQLTNEGKQIRDINEAVSNRHCCLLID